MYHLDYLLPKGNLTIIILVTYDLCSHFVTLKVAPQKSSSLAGTAVILFLGFS